VVSAAVRRLQRWADAVRACIARFWLPSLDGVPQAVRSDTRISTANHGPALRVIECYSDMQADKPDTKSAAVP
jgi:hypothetical protein